MSDNDIQSPTESVMYTLGQIARVVYAKREQGVPPNVLTLLLAKPAVGLGLMIQSREAKQALDERRTSFDKRLRLLVGQLPAELPESVKLEDQGPFWLGWYQTPAWPTKRDMEGLREAGEALYGSQWQTSLATELGLSDARRVRQWLAGERKIPEGVWDDIKRLLRERGGNALAVAAGMELPQPNAISPDAGTTED